MLQNSHAGRDPVRHLTKDADSAVLVRDGIIDFDSSVDGTRVQDDRPWLEPLSPLRRETKELAVV